MRTRNGTAHCSDEPPPCGTAAANPAGDTVEPRIGGRAGCSGRAVVMSLYLLFLMLPIYWLVNMSLKTNTEITTSLTLWPRDLTFDQLHRRSSPIRAGTRATSTRCIYVVINTVLSISLALPAAYAFSRYRFLGDKHLFFWLLTNRMAPPAVFALPFFKLYSAIGLFDTPWAVALAHCLFNVPLAVWILEGFMSGVPREIDETADIDGYSFPRFFVKIFMPLIASGIGVAAFFCFMFSWVELLLARTLTTVNAKPIAATMTRTVSAAGMDWGLLAAAGRADHRARRARDLVRPQLHRQGLRPGAGVRRRSDGASPGWPGPGRRRSSSPSSRCLLAVMTVLAILSPGDRARRHPAHPDHARRPAVHLAARRGFHPSRLARARRPEPVVGSRALARSTRRRCSAACERRPNELSGSSSRRE